LDSCFFVFGFVFGFDFVFVFTPFSFSFLFLAAVRCRVRCLCLSRVVEEESDHGSSSRRAAPKTVGLLQLLLPLLCLFVSLRLCRQAVWSWLVCERAREVVGRGFAVGFGFAVVGTTNASALSIPCRVAMQTTSAVVQQMASPFRCAVEPRRRRLLLQLGEGERWDRPND